MEVSFVVKQSNRNDEDCVIPEPSPEIAHRVAFMRDMAEASAERGDHFVYVGISESLGPFERGDKYAEPLAAALAESRLGEVTGGGQQLGKGNSIVYGGVDVSLTYRGRGFDLLIHVLRELGAPADIVIEDILPEFHEHRVWPLRAGKRPT